MTGAGTESDDVFEDVVDKGTEFDANVVPSDLAVGTADDLATTGFPTAAAVDDEDDDDDLAACTVDAFVVIPVFGMCSL